MIKDMNRNIRPRKELMGYKKGGYSFKDELKKRVKERQESILRGISIEPLVVHQSDMELIDCYTRYFVLKKLEKRSVCLSWKKIAVAFTIHKKFI